MHKKLLSLHSGYIALLSVLIVSAITSATVLILLTNSLSSALNSGDVREGRAVRALADACAELALYRISTDELTPCSSPTALCGEIIALPTGTCSVVSIENLGSNLQRIRTTGANSASTFTKYIELEVYKTTGVVPTIKNWGEVGGF